MLYLYCILEAGSEAAEMLAAGRLTGVEPAEPLLPLAEDGLVAAVSRVSEDTFGEEGLNALLTDLPRLAPYVVRHEEAVRALMQAAPAVVPVSFGAVYRDGVRVVDEIRARADELRALFVRLRGREEWGVKVHVDRARLHAAAARSEDVAWLAAEEAAAAPGRAYLLAKRRERLTVAETERLLARFLQEIDDRLGALSVERSHEPLPSDAAAGGLVMRAAFLVERGAVEEVRAAVADLNRSLGAAGVDIELSGPWAPYSFVRTRDG